MENTTQKYNTEIQHGNKTHHYLILFFTTRIQHGQVYTTHAIQHIIHIRHGLIQHKFCATRLYNTLIQRANQKIK